MTDDDLRRLLRRPTQAVVGIRKGLAHEGYVEAAVMVRPDRHGTPLPVWLPTLLAESAAVIHARRAPVQPEGRHLPWDEPEG